MTIILKDNLDEFMKAYEEANNSHAWANVEPFIADDASYWFTDGSFSGKEQICDAIQRTFDKIQDETYTISDLKWLVQSDLTAVCTYVFHWEGIVDGTRRSGAGRGTNVLVNNNDVWQIIHEHLSS